MLSAVAAVEAGVFRNRFMRWDEDKAAEVSGWTADLLGAVRPGTHAS